MNLSKCLILIPTLTLALAAAAATQETTSNNAQTKATTSTSESTAATGEAAATSPTISSREAEAATESAAETRQTIRQQFSQLLARHPDDLTRVLVLDPTLLSNDPFLGRYPELAQFLGEHPEIRRNPHYYLEDYSYVTQPPQQSSAFDHFAEMLSMMFVALLVISALAWLVRTIIDQKRWNQLSRRQSEVHTKILDRLGTSDELLTYIKSPAGAKYLESAPIPLHAAPVMRRTPVSRVLLSIQIGIVVASAGLGFLLVSTRTTGDAEQGFFAMGAVAFCIGAGFIVSAFVSMVISKRLGIAAEEAATPENMADDRG